MPRRPIGPSKTHARCVYAHVRNFRLCLWCGPWYMPIRLRHAAVWRDDAWSTFADRPEVLSMPRAFEGTVSAGAPINRSKSKVLGAFPELSSWLVEGAYPDGKPVGMVQLSIRPKGAVYVATLRIADQGGLMLQTEDVQLDDVLLLLEAALTASPTPWQRDPYPLGQISGKRK